MQAPSPWSGIVVLSELIAAQLAPLMQSAAHAWTGEPQSSGIIEQTSNPQPAAFVHAWSQVVPAPVEAEVATVVPTDVDLVEVALVAELDDVECAPPEPSCVTTSLLQPIPMKMAAPRAAPAETLAVREKNIVASAARMVLPADAARKRDPQAPIVMLEKKQW